MLQKLKSFHLKKKKFDKEVLYVFFILKIVSFLVKKDKEKGHVKV